VIDPASLVFYHPPEINKPPKRDLFLRIGEHIKKLGGATTGDAATLAPLPPHRVPVVGCSPQLQPMIREWQSQGRKFIYWDRGYARRVYATWLPRGAGGGFYRWHVGSYQMRVVREVAGDRWAALDTQIGPWQRRGEHIVVAKPSTTYCKFHGIEGWLDRTVYQLALATKRQIVVRDKESKRPLQDDLAGAHALVTHGSIAAVEAVIMGYPVFVDASSAAALVGKTDLNEIELPIYPDRTRWLNSLAYAQFDERELCDGTLWKLIV
jgi:hypothetical protein